MVKPISPRLHGMLDYLTAGALLVMPRRLGWRPPVTQLMTNLALGTLAYSALTRYPFGLVKVLPLPVHLVLDGVSGAGFILAPRFFPAEDTRTKGTLIGIGLFELAAALLTRTTTTMVVQPADARDIVAAENLPA